MILIEKRVQRLDDRRGQIFNHFSSFIENFGQRQSNSLIDGSRELPIVMSAVLGAESPEFEISHVCTTYIHITLLFQFQPLENGWFF